MTGITLNISNITNTSLTINDLLTDLNYTENILTYNSDIIEDIKNYGGSILYTYDNIIIASEISEEFYKQLLNNSNIDYIESLPLKSYGNADLPSIINPNISSIISGATTIDDYSGTTKNSSFINITPSGSSISQNGIPPIIINTGFTLSSNSNTTFNYDILASGTLPIRFEITKPLSFSGTLYIKNVSKLIGNSTKTGIYNITLKAINAFGSYTKDLILTVLDPVIITNTNLIIKNRLGAFFSYSIESSGSQPKTYSMYIMPTGTTSGLVLEGNMISGITLNSGYYDINIGVSGLTSSDSKILKLSVGTPPIINSSGILSGSANTYLEYTITSVINSGVSYNIYGALNDGLSLKGDKIYGTPILVGQKTVTIKAVNDFGESTKNLTITIYEM